MRKRSVFFGILFGLFAAGAAVAEISAPVIDWQAEKIDMWHGFPRHRFTVDRCACWVVVPPSPAKGNPWVWCMEFPEAFDTRTGVIPLVKKGFYYVYMSVGNTFGAPSALAHLDAFYRHLVGKGLNTRGALIGISRGGLYAYGFARLHPERVTCIYGDAPVCDFKSWPGGKGNGTGSAKDWASLIKCYGFRDEAEALAYDKNPVEPATLKVLRAAGIPLIHVVGDADKVVPPAENSALVEQRYRALGGTITVFHKPGCGHHPHGLDDPAPVVRLIESYAQMPDGNGWIQLFNGKNLDGWTPKIRGYPLGENFADTFRVEDGLLKVRYGEGYHGAFKNRFGHLFYKTPYSRYLLRVEYRFVGGQLPDGPGWAKRNNGIMIHGQAPDTMELDQSFPVSIEVQLLGGFEKGERSTLNLCTPGTNVEKNGKLYTPHTLNSSSRTYRGDQWVTAEIEVRGSEQIIHRIDGKTVLSYEKPQYDPRDPDAKKLIAAHGGRLLIDRGTISIQSESAPTDFRKIELKVLP